MKNSLKNTLKKGFTLTEMLIVILIIALLMAFIIPQLLKGPAAARDATRIARVNEIAAALESYRSSKGSYPTASTPICIDTIAASELSGFISADALKDPDANNSIDGSATCKGTFQYKTFDSKGIANNTFVVLTRLEGEKKGNINDTTITSISETTTLTPGSGRVYAKLGQ